MADKLVTKESLSEAYPEIIAEIQKESLEKGISEGEAKAKEGIAQAVETARKEGKTAEQARIKSIRALSISGHEALIETLMFDGETTGEQAAVKVLAAEKTLRESKLAAFQAEGKEIKVPVVEGTETPAGTVDPNLPVEERAKAEWDKNPDLRAEFGNSFTAFLAFKKADEAGSVKILGRRK